MTDREFAALSAAAVDRGVSKSVLVRERLGDVLESSVASPGGTAAAIPSGAVASVDGGGVPADAPPGVGQFPFRCPVPVCSRRFAGAGVVCAEHGRRSVAL